jgi:5-methylthioribose kinase
MGNEAVRAIVLDVEGTTTSIEFVKQRLFPFAREHIPDYVRDHAEEIRDLLDEVRRIEGERPLNSAQLIQVLLRWMDEDRKITPLKALQGLVWKQGYESGELRAHVYQDAVDALRRWHANELPLYVYSSGSVASQKLLFSHTDHGDLAPLFSGHFDTAIGSKLDADSYRAISASIALPANTILFLSDHPGEILAAGAAGLQAILVHRGAGAPAAADAAVITTFDDLVLARAPRRATASTPANRPASTSGAYRALTPDTVPEYLAGCAPVAARLGASAAHWSTREVGDGNLNLVFIVQGPSGSVVVKQALPYVRLVGDSWPLPLSRSHFEYLALREQGRWAKPFVPALYYTDPDMALIVMEHLDAHIVLRKGLIRGIRYPHIGAHLGSFLARTLYFTSDLHLPAKDKKQHMAQFLGNSAMCRISEDLIFDEPYFAAPMNRHTSPQLDAAAAALRRDVALKLAVQEMKWCFQNCAEALIHGDLHTGSVMVTGVDTRVIDPEFAFYGPMGFDVGAIIGNMLIAYLAQPGHETVAGDRRAYQGHLLDQTQSLWQTFQHTFSELWRGHLADAHAGSIYQPRLNLDAPELLQRAIDARLTAIWQQALGFAGSKMIRRIVGLAHVEDFEAIANPELRARCETSALQLARDLLVQRSSFTDMKTVIDAARRYA